MDNFILSLKIDIIIDTRQNELSSDNNLNFEQTSEIKNSECQALGSHEEITVHYVIPSDLALLLREKKQIDNKISAQAINKTLEKLGFQQRDRRRDCWKLTLTGMQYGRYERCLITPQKSTVQILWSEDVIDIIAAELNLRKK
jgi:hypothetical protein